MSNFFFDLDGTLIDVSEKHYIVYSSIIKKYGGSPLVKTRYWHLKRIKSSISNILHLSGLPSQSNNTFKNEFASLIELPEFLSFDTLFPDTIPVIKNLYLLGHKLYLISCRNSPQVAFTQLDKLGLRNFFYDIKIGILPGKNGSEIKTIYIKKIIKRAHGFVIGDTEDDILAAKKLDLTSVAVLSGIRSYKLLIQYHPDYIIRNIRYIPNHLLK